MATRLPSFCNLMHLISDYRRRELRPYFPLIDRAVPRPPTYQLRRAPDAFHGVAGVAWPRGKRPCAAIDSARTER